MKKSTDWSWLPEHARGAVAASGLFHSTSPYTQIGIARGKVWVTDGRFMIAIEEASALPRIKRSRGYRRARPVRSLADARLMGAQHYLAIALGRVVLQCCAHDMVRALWPGARWLTKGRTDPVFIQADGATVAVLMPLYCPEAA